MQACEEFHIQTNQARVRRKDAAAKALTISPKGGPCFGVQKTGPVLGSVFYVAIPFPIWNPKKGSIFPPQNWSFFCCFSVVAIALLRLRGWLIFIRISSSGRPTILTVGSWFVLWLLNNNQRCILGGYALRTRPWRWFWNPFPGTLFAPKTTSALWPRCNHLIPSNLGPFSHKHNILHPTRRKA